MKCVCIIVMLLNFVELISSEYRQEGGLVTTCNSKYFTDCVAITRRMKRGDSYTTNITATSRYEVGNNVTLKVTLQGEGYSEIQVVKLKCCEIVNTEWLYKYLTIYSNVDFKHCPFPAGYYRFINLKFPPKDMPQHIPAFFKGRLRLKLIVIMTKTEEIISTAMVDLHV